MNYCPKCGTKIKDGESYCPNCGTKVNNVYEGSVDDTTRTIQVPRSCSDKSRLVALLFCLFLGALGIHRFYVGKTGTGILWLLTAGVFGIGTLVDFILICLGEFKDSDGEKVTDWKIDD